jgi:hypothetical protein
MLKSVDEIGRLLAHNYYTKTELLAGALNSIYFLESEFVATSAGAGDAGKPVKLNGSGLVDASMMVGGSVAAHAALTEAHGATGAVVGTTNAQTLTNKTLTAPVIATISNTGTLTLPTSTDTLVGRATTDTLTNKTLTTPTIASFANAAHTHADAAGGGTVSHTVLTNIGTNTHTQIDTHIAATSAHGVTGNIVGTSGAQTLISKTLTSPTIGDFSNANHSHAGASTGGTIAHSVLTGLATGDPHTQYALTSGRSGGTTIYGGTDANDDISIQGTSNATRTTSYVLLQQTAGNVGIGQTVPTAKLHIGSGSPTVPAYAGTVMCMVAGGSIYMLNNATGDDTAFAVRGEATAGSKVHVVIAGDDSKRYAGFSGIVETQGVSGHMTFSTAAAADTLVERVRIDSGGDVGIGVTTVTAKLQVNGGVALVDGMTAPSTIAGYAQIYVDTADGDLKVKFGDGTTKTIATDT